MCPNIFSVHSEVLLSSSFMWTKLAITSAKFSVGPSWVEPQRLHQLSTEIPKNLKSTVILIFNKHIQFSVHNRHSDIKK